MGFLPLLICWFILFHKNFESSNYRYNEITVTTKRTNNSSDAKDIWSLWSISLACAIYMYNKHRTGKRKRKKKAPLRTRPYPDYEEQNNRPTESKNYAVQEGRRKYYVIDFV